MTDRFKFTGRYSLTQTVLGDEEEVTLNFPFTVDRYQCLYFFIFFNIDDVDDLVVRAINIVGKENLLLDPDCGLRRAPRDVAFEKLRLMNEVKDKYS